MLSLMADYFMAAVVFYRASEDAGMPLLDRNIFKNYLESYLITKELL